LEEIKSQTDFNVKTVSLVYGVGGDMKENLNRIVGEAVQAVKDGSEIVIISDRGVNDKNTYIPSVIATGAIHHRLIHEGLRSSCSIVVDTAQCWNTHHFAVLIGYGASAVCPYLTLETIR
jgi:glutamate synthase (ferredoxin)